jgi:putative peptidoglycan lipid II flippase
MHDERGLVRAAGSMSLMTALSRIAGYARDNLQASLLGAAASSDAFIIAFRIPNLVRRLLAEGALTSAFVPTFTRYMSRNDDRALWRFAASVFYALTVVLAAAVVVGEVLSPVLVRALAWGFALDPGKLALTVSLNRWLLPCLALMTLSALASGILNAFDVFTLPAFTPVLLNLSIIGAASVLAERFEDPSYAFAVGVLAGGLLQLAVQIPPLLARGLDLRPPRPFDAAGVLEVGRLVLPRLFGAGITQINLVVDSQFASLLRAGSVSFLYYAIRVTELTLGLFAVSLSTVILPRLSRAAASADRGALTSTLGTALRLLGFVTLPATVGLILLRLPIVATLFQRGRFSAEDALFTSESLAFYAAGLLPYAAIGVLAVAFHAQGDTRTPVIVGAGTFALHLALNAALSAPLAHRGIALSTALSALADAVLLTLLLRRRSVDVIDRSLAGSLLRSGAAAAAMGAALHLALLRIDFGALSGTGPRALALAGLIAGGGGLYLAVARLLGSDELRLLLASFGAEAGNRCDS